MAQRVLIVEDDRDIAETVQEIIRLDAPHFETVLAVNGHEAEQALAEEPRPCLIFLDLHMPQMGGDEFLERKRHDPRTKEIPVVVMTATQESRDGSDHVTRTIYKPFELSVILQELDNHCP